MTGASTRCRPVALRLLRASLQKHTSPGAGHLCCTQGQHGPLLGPPVPCHCGVQCGSAQRNQTPAGCRQHKVPRHCWRCQRGCRVRTTVAAALSSPAAPCEHVGSMVSVAPKARVQHGCSNPSSIKWSSLRLKPIMSSCAAGPDSSSPLASIFLQKFRMHHAPSAAPT